MSKLNELTIEQKASLMARIIDEGYLDYFYTCDKYENMYIVNTGEPCEEPATYTVLEMANLFEDNKNCFEGIIEDMGVEL